MSERLTITEVREAVRAEVLPLAERMEMRDKMVEQHDRFINGRNGGKDGAKQRLASLEGFRARCKAGFSIVAGASITALLTFVSDKLFR